MQTEHISGQTREKHHMNSILPNVLYMIGGTPVIRINRINKEEGIACELVAKCEYYNAGGSVKDRIAKGMVEDAERRGVIQPGRDTIIEPTSGNTGIGLALCCAVKGYDCLITMPQKMSKEKSNMLQLLGAEVIRTPTEAAFDAPESHISVARAKNEEIEHSWIPNQYDNPWNPLSHYETTAEEILMQTGGKLDVVVISAGTGGTVTGIAMKLKEKLPHIIVVGVDPVGSLLADPENDKVGTYLVEGIGYDFVPKVLKRDLVDYWYKSSDRESLRMARRIIGAEGMFVGGSSGAAMCAAVHYAKKLNLGADKRMLVLFPDSVRNYMSKFVDKDWCKANGILDENE
jgi:cystathionine beta-synthase